MNVLLTAFGSSRYGEWAWNLAHSINYFCDVNITLVHDKKAVSEIDRRPFHRTITIPTPTLHGKLHPAQVKLSLNKWVEDEAIYIDADSIVFKDLKGLFEKCRSTGKNFLVEVQEWKKKGTGKFEKMLWAGEDMYDHFGVDKMPATNSSFQYLKKSGELDELFGTAFEQLMSNRYDYSKAPFRWGKGEDPDELYLNAAIAKTGIDPSISTPVHYPIRNSERLAKAWSIEKINNKNQLHDKYYILSYAGDGRNINRFGKEFYNMVMRDVMRANNMMHIRKIELLLKRKFIR